MRGSRPSRVDVRAGRAWALLFGLALVGGLLGLRLGAPELDGDAAPSAQAGSRQRAPTWAWRRAVEPQAEARPPPMALDELAPGRWPEAESDPDVGGGRADAEEEVREVRFEDLRRALGEREARRVYDELRTLMFQDLKRARGEERVRLFERVMELSERVDRAIETVRKRR